MNVPKNILDYYTLMETIDTVKHPINYIKPEIVFNQKEIELYFNRDSNNEHVASGPNYSLKNIYGGSSCNSDSKILIF